MNRLFGVSTKLIWFGVGEDVVLEERIFFSIFVIHIVFIGSACTSYTRYFC